MPADGIVLYLCWVLAMLIVGHLYWGRRWMIDGTRDMWSVYVRLGTWARRRMTK